MLLWSRGRQTGQETESSCSARGRAAGAEHRPLAPESIGNILGGGKEVCMEGCGWVRYGSAAIVRKRMMCG